MDRIEVKFSTDDLDAITGEFSGYGAVFGNVDSHGDVIMPKAFDATLKGWRDKGRFPSMKLMHGAAGNPFANDDLPIGVWTMMREDDRGLQVEGKLSALDSDMGKRVAGLMRDGALSGLSIGYRAKKSQPAPRGSTYKRSLEELDLIEVSVVDMPSNDRARVLAMKAAERITTIREFEDFLRDVGGFSNAQAKAIASHGFKAADPRDEDEAILAALRRNLATIKI